MLPSSNVTNRPSCKQDSQTSLVAKNCRVNLSEFLFPERCSSHGRGFGTVFQHYLHICTSGGHDVQLSRLHRLTPVCLVPPLVRVLVYGGLSTFTLVTFPVKHLWNRMSGLGGWLSQSSFLLMKCFLKMCGPLDEVSLV